MHSVILKAFGRQVPQQSCAPSQTQGGMLPEAVPVPQDSMLKSLGSPSALSSVKEAAVCWSRWQL